MGALGNPTFVVCLHAHYGADHIPSDGVPHFFKRCAVTRELFDMIVELRPSLTSGGLSVHVKRKLSQMFILEEYKNHRNSELHLLNYHKKVLEYLTAFESLPDTRLVPLPLKNFSEPHDKLGFNGNSISNDTVTEVFLGFSEKTRIEESDEYTRTLTGTA